MSGLRPLDRLGAVGGCAACAVLSVLAQAEEDLAAAKAATQAASLVVRNNRIGDLIGEEAFQLWTDERVVAYVRFVVDGHRFGFHPETEVATREVNVGDDGCVRPNGDAETILPSILPDEFAHNHTVELEICMR